VETVEKYALFYTSINKEYGYLLFFFILFFGQVA